MKHPTHLFTLVCFLLLLCLNACNTTNNKGEGKDKNKTPFFDVKGFFEGQANTLTQKDIAIRKTATLNNEKEEQLLKDIDWASELSVFINSDINKPAWFQQYAKDSTRQTNITTISYTALKPDLRTQSLNVTYNNDSNEVTGISIQNKTDNIVYTQQEQLTYKVNKGYTIKTKQKIIFQEEQTFIIDANFQ